ncbi:MAG: FtsQ-type POTRA domain-containing protein, partial [Pseudomonadota bacterium]|nr:FtsQ-type POTRA domain-containing protein [Pseudomonadota bacterium]
MQKIKKYKYLLILLSFVVSLIFINFSNDGKIKRDITSGFIELFSISNIEIIGRDRSSKNTLSKLLKPYENQSLVTLNLKNIQHEIEKITWIKDVTVRRVY